MWGLPETIGEWVLDSLPIGPRIALLRHTLTSLPLSLPLTQPSQPWTPPSPPMETQETRTVNIVEPEPEPQPSTSAAAYGVFSRLGPRPPVIQLEIDSSDEDLGKYSPASEVHEEEEDVPPIAPKPILKPPSRTIVI
jgi:hypothetical protein